MHATNTTPALASAGTGDVLTGITAAFLAKGIGAAGRGRGRGVAHGLAALRSGKTRGSWPAT